MLAVQARDTEEVPSLAIKGELGSHIIQTYSSDLRHAVILNDHDFLVRYQFSPLRLSPVVFHLGLRLSNPKTERAFKLARSIRGSDASVT